MPSVEQIKAARALLGWSQKDLAEHATLSQTGIARIENGTHQPNTATMNKIQTAFDKEGIVFSRNGVEHYKNHVYTLNSFMEVLEDAEQALNGDGEILFHCADERRNTEEITKKLQELAPQGIKARVTCCEGNTHITMDPSCYRWIDKDYYADSDVSVIYADKYVLQVVSNENRRVFIVVRNNDFSRVMRNQFEYWWKRGKKWKS